MHRIDGAEKNATIKAYEKTNYCIKRPRSTNFIPSTHTQSGEREGGANTEKHCAKSNERSFLVKKLDRRSICALLYACRTDSAKMLQKRWRFCRQSDSQVNNCFSLARMQSNHEKSERPRKKRDKNWAITWGKKANTKIGSTRIKRNKRNYQLLDNEKEQIRECIEYKRVGKKAYTHTHPHTRNTYTLGKDGKNNWCVCL